MDEFDKMLRESKKFTKLNLDKKKRKLKKEVEEYEFKNLYDAVEFLFELRAKREKSIKDKTLIKIIEQILKDEPFEYRDEDYILEQYKDEICKDK
ncbi:MAG: hypothetical protein QME45_13565 [Clostridiales bacterium]|nr:hypothetical protein [Clostridiales bacterium]HBM79395.1 hypothetical protein [Clostridiaceae bacterium]